MSVRLISHSEIETLQDCALRWEFSYSDRLLGFSIATRDPNVYLRRGKAWGRGVARWHETGSLDAADALMLASIEKDAARQQAAGTYDADAHAELWTLLRGSLADYANTVERLNVHSPEFEINVPIPSRTGRRKSSRYRLQARLDNLAVKDGETYIVEYKYRSSLSSLEDLLRSRQHRIYAWGYREQFGIEVRGTIIDERLAEIPSPVRFNGDGSVSRVQSCNPVEYVEAFGRVPMGVAALSKSGKPLKSQACHPDLYERACVVAGVEPDGDVLARLEARYEPDGEILDGLHAKKWQNRETVLFSPGELDEAGEQLVTAARLIQGHESGEFYPIRNPVAHRCRSCFAKDVCLTPTDSELAAALYDVKPAKRKRVAS